MLNFYNYYDKMHPELMKRLKDIENKLSGVTGIKSNVLIIRNKANIETSENYREGETITFSGNFNRNDETITITEEMMQHIIRDIDIIILYYSSDSTCRVFYKQKSSFNTNYASFKTLSQKEIEVSYCKLTYRIAQ